MKRLASGTCTEGNNVFAVKLRQAKKEAIQRAMEQNRTVKVEKTTVESVSTQPPPSTTNEPQVKYEGPQDDHGIAEAPQMSQAPRSNVYAGLVSAKKKRKRAASDLETPASKMPEKVTPFRTNPDQQAKEKRPFAPAKKPAKAQRPRYESIVPIQARTSEHSSDWYQQVDMKQRYSRGDLENLKYLISVIRECEQKANVGEDVEASFAKLRQRIHQMEFYGFLSGILVKKSRLLEEEGLPAIFQSAKGVDYPWDLQADSLSLYRKWLVGVWDPFLLRGVETKQKTTASGKQLKTRNLERGYVGRISCNYVGEGNLQNGQWWPLQICAMRDGAHGEIEAGIHGQAGKGAFSIVLSSGGYSDIDEGATLKYCGTSGSEAKASAGTSLLKEALRLRNPVRVLRSSALPAKNKYRPSKGLRYDGLYNIVGFELLDEETAMHQFSLQRVAGQQPIRYKDAARRPTNVELAEYSKIRGLLGLGN